MNSEFWLYNGDILRTDCCSQISKCFPRWGYFFAEEMHVAANRIFFLEAHLQQIRISLKLFGMPEPTAFHGDGVDFQRIISRLLNKCRYYMGAVVHLYVFEGGWCVLPEALSKREYEVSEEGCMTDVYREMTKPVHPLSVAHLGTVGLWSITAHYAKERNLSCCLIMNNHGFICEATGANLFILKGTCLRTPSLESGAYHDVIREKIMKSAEKIKLTVQTVDELSFSEVQNADELFVANAAYGIKWIRGIGRRRYYCRRTLDINKELNLLADAN